ncbi:MAG: transglutaminase [Bacteroidota bacterium]|nr:transglutaminase [Bacteroidota bacterium]
MNNSSHGTSFGDLLVGFLSFVLALPLFIIAHKQLPHYDWPYHLDRILLFVVIVLLLLLVLRLFRFIIVIGVIVAIGWLTYGSMTGKYGFINVYHDYRAMIYTMKDDPNPVSIILPSLSSFPHQSEFVSAINDNNNAARNFAITAANENFKEEQQRYFEYRTLVQCFAIFKKINTNWNYVSDSRSREYFARPGESAKLLAGDCDDYSILMAACIQSVGAVPRLIYTTGHVYPEIFIGNKNDLEQMNYLIKQRLFFTESRDQKINYHVDEKGRIWLNMDYTAKYPGGPFMAEKVLGVLNL